MSDTFKDYIPEGEDAGAIAEDGFRDWVPPVEPRPQVIEQPAQPEEQVVVEEQQPIIPPLEGGQQ